MADEKLVKARVVGVSSYAWSTRNDDGSSQAHTADRGETIEVSATELARGESLNGALLRESEAKRADNDAGVEVDVDALRDVDLAKQSVAQLRVIAAGLPIDDLADEASKDELVAAIANALHVLQDVQPPAPGS